MDSPQSYSEALKSAFNKNLIDEDDSSIIFMDNAILLEKVNSLRSAFPSSAIHAVAIKSNPLLSTLKYLKSIGTSVEAASMGEVFLAKEAGFKNEEIVFDSPAKTKREIETLEKKFPGLYVNADSVAELQRYPKDSSLKLGLRINPGTDSKTVDYLNVSGPYSKFGELITNRNKIISTAINTPGLEGLHIHQGSQISSFDNTASNIKKILHLANEINEQVGYKKIKVIDIGGGFPVNYLGSEPYRISDYASAILEECEELKSGHYQIITEFGRYVHAHAGWVATRVEYVKEFDNRTVAILHVGADLFLRECYAPGDWPHKFFVLDSNTMKLKTTANINPIDLAGPLCFAGDYIAKNVELPQINEGDWLIIADAGANSFALWSRHCSRKFPKVISFNQTIDNSSKVAKQRENYTDIINFWS